MIGLVGVKPQSGGAQSHCLGQQRAADAGPLMPGVHVEPVEIISIQGQVPGQGLASRPARALHPDLTTGGDDVPEHPVRFLQGKRLPCGQVGVFGYAGAMPERGDSTLIVGFVTTDQFSLEAVIAPAQAIVRLQNLEEIGRP